MWRRTSEIQRRFSYPLAIAAASDARLVYLAAFLWLVQHVVKSVRQGFRRDSTLQERLSCNVTNQMPERASGFGDRYIGLLFSVLPFLQMSA